MPAATLCGQIMVLWSLIKDLGNFFHELGFDEDIFKTMSQLPQLLQGLLQSLAIV